MNNKNFFVLILTWICLIETVLGAAGWCYQCDSRDVRCQINVDPTALIYHKVPCNGQCYIRMANDLMSRGCSWEHGFMQKQLSYSPIFEKDSVWIFCDTPLCNTNANGSG